MPASFQKKVGDDVAYAQRVVSRSKRGAAFFPSIHPPLCILHASSTSVGFLHFQVLATVSSSIALSGLCWGQMLLSHDNLFVVYIGVFHCSKPAFRCSFLWGLPWSLSFYSLGNLGCAKVHSKTGWHWPQSNPFACLTDAGISSVRHHAWRCCPLGPCFNCKWLYIFLPCMCPLVIKSWRKGLHGPPVLFLYGARCTASSPWLTVATWPSASSSWFLSMGREWRTLL